MKYYFVTFQGITSNQYTTTWNHLVCGNPIEELNELYKDTRFFERYIILNSFPLTEEEYNKYSKDWSK